MSGCTYCIEGKYWCCGDGVTDDECCDEIVLASGGGPWTLAGCEIVPADDRYYVKCKPGCDAELSTDPETTPPWSNKGYIDPLPAGLYALLCKTDGSTCEVRVIPIPCTEAVVAAALED